jgi:hypothetical protein
VAFSLRAKNSVGTIGTNFGTKNPLPDMKNGDNANNANNATVVSRRGDLQFDTRRARVKTCPCGRSNRDGKFAPFKGYDDKGYCHSCGQTFRPEQDVIAPQYPYTPPPPKPASYIDFNTFSRTRTAYHRNSFTKWLSTLFDADTLTRIIQEYHIGTSKYRDMECVIFWQLDTQGRVRTGHVMNYGSDGHRVKDEGQVNTWVHKIMNLEGFNLQQCFFGEHLLRRDSRPVMIVESEKTACIGSGYLPAYTWLATAGSTNLRKKSISCKELKGRNVTLIPDARQYEAWKEVARDFGFNVSNLINEVATEEEIKADIDIADYLIKYKPDQIQPPQPIQQPQPEPPQADTLPGGNYFETLKDGRTIEMCAAGYSADWNIKPANSPVILDSSAMTILRTKYPHVRELMDRLECVEARPEGILINADEFLNKPKAMPMMSIEDYRRNGWRAK